MTARRVAIFVGLAVIAVIAIAIYMFTGSNSPAEVGWNPADKGENISLSDNNATATQTGAPHPWETVRGMAGKSSGRWYFRLRVDAVDGEFGWIGGIASLAAPLSSYIGSDSHGAGFQSRGDFWQDGKSHGNAWTGANQGKMVDIAVDLGGHKIWAKVDGSSSWNGAAGNSPADGTGGLDVSRLAGEIVFPAFSGTLKAFGKGTSESDTTGEATLDTSTVLSDPTLAGFTNWGGGR